MDSGYLRPSASPRASCTSTGQHIRTAGRVEGTIRAGVIEVAKPLSRDVSSVVDIAPMYDRTDLGKNSANRKYFYIGRRRHLEGSGYLVSLETVLTRNCGCRIGYGCPSLEFCQHC